MVPALLGSSGFVAGKVLLSTSAERATSSLQRPSLSDRKEEKDKSQEGTEQQDEYHELQDDDEEILNYVPDQVIDRRGTGELIATKNTARDVTKTLFTEIVFPETEVAHTTTIFKRLLKTIRIRGSRRSHC